MLELILALFPFILITYLLLVRNIRADIVMGLVFITSITSSLLAWDRTIKEVTLSSITGALLAVDVILIIGGILLVFSLLEQKGHLKHLEDFFMRISTDVHIHIILMGFLLVIFLEGIAGFGLPALIVAPLLIMVGLKPLSAISISLFSDSIAVVFGAFGTPFTVGLASVDTTGVVTATAIVTGIIMLITPLLLLSLHTIIEKKPLASIRRYVKLALVTGAITSTAFVASAFLLGPELPSVLASLVGMITIIPLLRKNIFHLHIRKPRVQEALPALKSYGLIVAILIISRLNILNIGQWLKNQEIILSTLNYSISLYHPGVLILIATGILFALQQPTAKQLSGIKEKIITRAVHIIITLLATLMFVQLLIDAQIPTLLAGAFTNTGLFYALFAGILGTVGSFIAGSVTVSNLMLASLHADAALLNNLSQPLVLTAQVVGAAAGNIIAIHNVLAVLAVVHLRHGMRRVLLVNGILAGIICLGGVALVYVLSAFGFW